MDTPRNTHPRHLARGRVCMGAAFVAGAVALGNHLPKSSTAL